MDSLDLAYAHLLQSFPALYQISISRGGKVIFERTNPAARESTASIMFRSFTRWWAKLFSAPLETFQHRINGRSNIRSAAKSILALLVGIALRDGLISSLDQKLGNLLPEEFTSDIEPAKRRISIRHLLTMTSGLASIESGRNALRMFTAPNWTRFMLHLPLVSEPGERFLYNSANPHLVSAVLSHLSGESLIAYANRNLFEPLGIREVVWGASPEGVTFGGSNLFLSAEELSRIGQLCLCRGEWQGRQIIPESWFDEMWCPYQEYFPDWKYGYYWYLHPETHPQTGHRYMTYSAAGTGGQKLLLIPELGVVLSAVAVTDFIAERGLVLNQFISTELIPAIENAVPKGE
jgi:CubicO group peptidase (beta-lactamase class C family)